jgi:carbamoyl-phosphate synthase large subunit
MAFKIMLTCVGGELVPHLIQMLRKGAHSNIYVIGVDAEPDAIGSHFCDQFFQVPRGDNPNYIPEIVKILKQYPVDLIIPTSDEEAVAMSSSRSLLEQNGTSLACMDSDTLTVLEDKAKTYRFLKKAGLHVPDWQEVTSFDKLELVTKYMIEKHGEVVVKPIRARGSRGVHVVSSSVSGIIRTTDNREIHCDLDGFFDELMSSLKKDFPIMVMERLVEPVYDIDMLAWKGEPKSLVARRRVNSAAPNEGHVIVDNSELYDLGNQLINIFNLSWLYDCDVMYDKTNRPCILEINPRQSGSVSVSIAAGIPLLDQLISLAKNESFPYCELPFGKKVIPYIMLKVI